MSPRNQREFRRGMRMATPIALGYFTVSFSLGILAKKSGLTILETILSSMLVFGSASQYALFTAIAAGSGYLQIAMTILITNARYFLMSCAVGQKIDQKTTLGGRLLCATALTDESFAIDMMQTHPITPKFQLGMLPVTMLPWTIGSVLGSLVGSILPPLLITAFGICLYGMFLSSIVPSAKASPIMLAAVIVSFTLSFLSSILPLVSELDASTRTILLTIIISAVFAAIFPIPEKEGSAHD